MATALATPRGYHLPAPQLGQSGGNSRSLRILVLMSGVAVLNGVDLLSTLLANRIDMLYEMNPLASVFLQQGMVSSLVSFKVLMVFCGLGMLWKLRASRWTVPACWTLLVAYAYLGLVWYRWACLISNTCDSVLSDAARSAPLQP